MMHEIFQIVDGFERYFWQRSNRTYYVSEHLDVAYCHTEDNDAWWRSEVDGMYVRFPARNNRAGFTAESNRSRTSFTIIRMPRDG
jgi:hypothetical protein